ncbi:NADH:ubiquinone reductase (Na(+)-transporting) subunit A [Kiritimatiella glycovorans]|uniref:Na(+)-translocating NADH-quinone reductase subunit A n=1 Tax=Kiritimatiella glycovorans TaxID=1307763 RepID=A0A0G3EC49_9BACT|nr:NADH:ubiquinone reductase (Na(+)-transporting) subunit A [Kiritimatiella glycovorans]AKJ63853.1 Na(+)-translocating NADH-quinone reductase subunit A [Kiritimatiella glycovorans]
MTEFRFKQGMRLPIEGVPASGITEWAASSFALCPLGLKPFKGKPAVREGDTVARGAPLLYNKRMESLVLRAPVGGRITSIAYGERRAIRRIEIRPEEAGDPVTFKSWDPGSIASLDRDTLASHLLDAGLWALIRQRPFARIADPASAPKAVFVNACATAPFRPDPSVVVEDGEDAFRAGLTAMAALTDGAVHVCSGPNFVPPLPEEAGGRIRHDVFRGPHPSGNTSVHIHHLAPIRAGETVYTIEAGDVVQIGRLLLGGELPKSKVIALGGPAAGDRNRTHYRIAPGAVLDELVRDAVGNTETRAISGDIFSGLAMEDSVVDRPGIHALSLLPEDRSRTFLGWTAPGWNAFSVHRLYPSALRKGHRWRLGTSTHGRPRAMVLTGWYDRYLPMKINIDYLVRAVIAHDVEEAIELGILETDPEDFAPAAFACPSKMELSEIIRRGLEEIEEEGL